MIIDYRAMQLILWRSFLAPLFCLPRGYMLTNWSISTICFLFDYVRQVAGLLSQTFFMAFALTILAALARLRVLSQQVSSHFSILSTIYQKWFVFKELLDLEFLDFVVKCLKIISCGLCSFWFLSMLVKFR